MMEKKIRELIEDLKNKGFIGKANPKEEINIWYVVAKLEEILLEDKAK